MKCPYAPGDFETGGAVLKQVYTGRLRREFNSLPFFIDRKDTPSMTYFRPLHLSFQLL